MRTRLSICAKKARFVSARDALHIAEHAALPLRPYRCDRCRMFHLTSRTKGKRVARPGGIASPTFKAEAERQARLIAASQYEAEDQAFVDAISEF
jgi:hypothetical protein